MTYRNDIDALAARHAALSNEVEATTRDLDATSRLLEEARAKARLPILPNLRVASPCTADWDAMTGDERVRMCGSCNKNVYSLSNLTRDEAEALIVEKEGKLCVRYFQRKDGTILLKDCTIGTAQRRKRRIIAAGAAALLASGGGVFLALRGHHKVIAPAPVSYLPEAPPEEHHEAIMGGAVAEPHDDAVKEMKGDYAGPPVEETLGQATVDMGQHK